MDQLEDQDGITAYHGSPYDFQRFDLSKIGTGEGAQSFGHGLYFAEAEPTAISYRDRLAKEGPTSGNTIADEFAIHPDWQKTMSEEDIADHLEDVKRKAEKIFFEGGKQKYLFSDNSILTDEGDHFRAGQKEKGHMYEVSIKAHPDHFLDWDKPIRDQKHFLAPILEKFGGEQSVRDAYAAWDKLNNDLVVNGQVVDRTPGHPLWQEYDRLTSLGPDRAKIRLGVLLDALDKEEAKPEKYRPESTLTRKGEDLWHAISQMHKNNEVASNMLRELGIPGIKYLDAGSRPRGIEKGSRNYVVFDDKLVTTKRKYARGGIVNA